MFFTLTILIAPPATSWLIGRRWRRWKQLRLNQITIVLWLLALSPICSATAVYFTDFLLRQPYAMQMTEPLTLYQRNTIVTNAQLHGLAGWQGVDIKAGCGAEILAPFDGVVTYSGLDGYNHADERGVIHDQATMLTIAGGSLQLTLLHGDYLPKVNDRVNRGQVIGFENNHGWSSGCHSHVILKENGRLVNFLEWRGAVRAAYPLRISTYRPELGGINCDSDCSTMASGDKVSSWVGGRGGVFAAACPRSNGWSHGARFSLDGITYECRDTGGWINCYDPGMYDPALKRMATESYCWVDLLGSWDYPYGSLVNDWYRIR